jgi:1-aminocyclopropane-1-carboxylate synthase
VLSTFLNFPKLFPNFLITYRERLEDRYALCTNFLKAHSIPYIPSNAGCFILADLSEYIAFERGQTPLEQERSLTCRLFGEGIHLIPSETFHGEDPGWYRISFAVDKDALETGLARYCALTNLLRRELLLRLASRIQL